MPVHGGSECMRCWHVDMGGVPLRAFFSHCQMPTELNYDVGNQKLVLVLALQEWQH